MAKRGNPNWHKGTSGNPKGRPKVNWRDNLEAAIAKVEKDLGIDLFEHAIRQSVLDNTLLAAILRKRVPDLKAVEARIVSESPYRLVIELPRPDAKQLTETIPVKLPDKVVSNRKPVKSRTKPGKPNTKLKGKLDD